MCHLRAYVGSDQVDDVVGALSARPGVRHVVLSGTTADTGATLVTAVLESEAVDDALADSTPIS